jgi:hypothetical protein
VRTVWFVAGAAAGVYVTSKARAAAEALTVDGLHDRLTGWFAGARVLREEVRAGMTEKESELRDRLAEGVDGTTNDNVRQLPSSRHLELTGKGDD